VLTVRRVKSAAVRRAALALALLAAAGCGGATTYPVGGTVEWKGGGPAKELAGGQVIFESADGKVSAVGTIREDGAYRLTTTKADDGAPAGDYKVLVTPPPTNPEKPKPPVLHADYQNLDKTKLRATVERKNNTIDFVVERAGK
jgi:hypothetical protein